MESANYRRPFNTNDERRNHDRQRRNERNHVVDGAPHCLGHIRLDNGAAIGSGRRSCLPKLGHGSNARGPRLCVWRHVQTNPCPFSCPGYALAQGAVVGAISKVFNLQYPGIVLQAVGATIGVFVVMLVLYRTGVLRVTDKFRRIIIGATLGLMVFYLFSFVAGFFGANLIPSGSSAMSIGFSVLVAGLAAMNLALDFDFIDKAEAAGAPKHMEWFAAFGIMVTLVWLYMEILRLLSKLRDR